MAPEFEDSPTMERTTVPQAAQDTSGDFEVGLTVIWACANILFNARRDNKIVFAPGVTGKMLETMGILLMRAAHTSGPRRDQMFQHWLEVGERMTDKLVVTVSARRGQMLMPDDLTMFLEKPGGYEI